MLENIRNLYKRVVTQEAILRPSVELYNRGAQIAAPLLTYTGFAIFAWRSAQFVGQIADLAGVDSLLWKSALAQSSATIRVCPLNTHAHVVEANHYLSTPYPHDGNVTLTNVGANSELLVGAKFDQNGVSSLLCDGDGTPKVPAQANLCGINRISYDGTADNSVTLPPNNLQRNTARLGVGVYFPEGNDLACTDIAYSTDGVIDSTPTPTITRTPTVTPTPLGTFTPTPTPSSTPDMSSGERAFEACNHTDPNKDGTAFVFERFFPPINANSRVEVSTYNFGENTGRLGRVDIFDGNREAAIKLCDGTSIQKGLPAYICEGVAYDGSNDNHVAIDAGFPVEAVAPVIGKLPKDQCVQLEIKWAPIPSETPTPTDTAIATSTATIEATATPTLTATATSTLTPVATEISGDGTSLYLPLVVK